jgi:nucleoside-diphosphate-sugar epimerase
LYLLIKVWKKLLNGKKKFISNIQSMKNKERIFITGGMGYIGSAFAKEALKKGYDVCLFDSLMYEQNRFRMIKEISGNKENSAKLKLVIGDNRNKDLLKKNIEAFRPTFVLHLGELSSVYACNHNPIFTEDNNFIASKQVIDICEGLNLKVLYNSTSSVYGTQKESRLMTEKDILPEDGGVYKK